ncbi:MAG TPA: serine/threonine-protein kinase [Planctomycetaceae bacterium]|nr:serine/threonine-protein kinase [Planctomycetaceae bacterium]
MESVSDRLRQALLELRLCRPGDLRRCRRRVRRLAHDLPAFDSVWIDALLQARRLTPFQARTLESGRAADLAVGPCVLLDRLGEGRWAATYLARVRDGRQQCVLKVIELPVELLPAGLENLQRLAERFKADSHPHVVGPHSALRHGERLVAISRYVDGLRLSELLVRRGRFAPEIVLAVARQLVDGLAAVEEQGVVHGDIRLPNVRLTRGGQVVLVDAGIAPAVVPQLTIHAGLPPDRYDGIAPELIGTGQAPTARSDIYALGCLLWQLLAGRPPFPTGDPLAKLAAHQTRPIDDVREWAPDTPEPLAKMVARFTSRDPQDRPGTFGEIRERLRPARRAGTQRLARFRSAFSSGAVRQGDAAAANRRWALTAGLLVALGGATLAVVDQGVRNDVLAILPGRLQRLFDPGTVQSRQNPNEPDDGPEAGLDELRALPPADAEGVVRLDSAGPYALGSIRGEARLVLRGAGNVRPLLVVGEEPAVLTAVHVVLENVVVVRPLRMETPDSISSDGHAGRPVPRPLLMVQSQGLELSECWFDADVLRPAESGDPASAANSNGAPLVWWRPLDSQDPAGGRIAIEDTVFATQAGAMRLVSSPARIEAGNCLMLGTGALFELQGGLRPGGALRIRIDRTTLRGCEALLSWHVPSDVGGGGAITVDATDCVFDLAGPRAALFQLIAERVSRSTLPVFQITGEGSLASASLAEVARVAPDGRGFLRLDDSSVAVHIEGLTTAPFEFAGPPSRRPADSVVHTIGGPRIAARTPGIAAEELASGEP